MNYIKPLNRRSSLTTLGAFSVTSRLGLALPPEEPSAAPKRKFAFVLSPNAITSFTILPSGQWRETATIQSSSPASFNLSPDRQTLYIANAINTFEHRPTASVEAYAIDPRDGSLQLRNRCGLALFANKPTQLALSPDSSTLTVLSNEGSVQSILLLEADGSLGRVIAAHKQILPSAFPS